MSMSNNGKDTKYTRQIARRIKNLRNGVNCYMQNIDWCKGGLQLSDIGTNNFVDRDLTPRIKYIMVKLDN